MKKAAFLLAIFFVACNSSKKESSSNLRPLKLGSVSNADVASPMSSSAPQSDLVSITASGLAITIRDVGHGVFSIRKLPSLTDEYLVTAGGFGQEGSPPQQLTSDWMTVEGGSLMPDLHVRSVRVTIKSSRKTGAIVCFVYSSPETQSTGIIGICR